MSRMENLIDTRARLRRTSTALVLAAVAGTATYAAASNIPDARAAWFALFTTAMVAAGVFSGALAFLARRDRAKWHHDRTTPARVVLK